MPLLPRAGRLEHTARTSSAVVSHRWIAYVRIGILITPNDQPGLVGIDIAFGREADRPKRTGQHRADPATGSRICREQQDVAPESIVRIPNLHRLTTKTTLLLPHPLCYSRFHRRL